jgi:hypothetical protein
MKNDVYVLQLRRMEDRCLWVFDDARFGLKSEPFVGNANAVIDDLLTRQCRGGAKECTVMFSRYRLPDFDVKFRRIVTPVGMVVQEDGSAWFLSDELNVCFWLCPALRHYFDTVPDWIFVKVLA